jgi:hypothetical protein
MPKTWNLFQRPFASRPLQCFSRQGCFRLSPSSFSAPDPAIRSFPEKFTQCTFCKFILTRKPLSRPCSCISSIACGFSWFRIALRFRISRPEVVFSDIAQCMIRRETHKRKNIALSFALNQAPRKRSPFGADLISLNFDRTLSSCFWTMDSQSTPMTIYSGVLL